MRHKVFVKAFFAIVVLVHQPIRADLIGYWSADSTQGQGETLVNDQGNSDLDGEIVEASYTGNKGGHTGLEGDYAIEFEGLNEDYAVIPPSDEIFEEITITAWINGFPNGDWTGIVVSRNDPQTMYLGFTGGTTDLAYVWNDNSDQTWGWLSEVTVPEDEWTFVAMTVTEEAATLYAGPKGGALDFNSNEIEHFPQDNFGEWRLAEDNCCGDGRNFAGLIDDVSIWNDALSLEDLTRLHDGTATPLNLRGPVGLPGDFNMNGGFDVEDVDLLTAGTLANDLAFDLNSDGMVDPTDRSIWVKDLAGTWFGDANFDGEFSSSDLVSVFQAGLFETEQPATWAQGDWSGDGVFNSSDFVIAFQDGGFELGPRPATAVPEPASLVLLAIGGLCLIRRFRRD